MIRIVLQENDFDAAAELAALRSDDAGAIASFTGTVRADAHAQPRLSALYIEHYPGMTERALTRIANDAVARWSLAACTVIHRTGRLLPGQNIVFVGAASAHRQAALSATAFLIDWLKTGAPLWKREDFSSGACRWVAAREQDQEAARSWLA